LVKTKLIQKPNFGNLGPNGKYIFERALKAIAKKAIERKTGARGFAQLWKRL